MTAKHDPMEAKSKDAAGPTLIPWRPFPNIDVQDIDAAKHQTIRI
jgi:hypothetical protein